ncbi:Spy/CpxP family protein refolding chaperone [Rhizobium sp. BK251]|uniref:Spy/CpxP family protein refolding chaperone n=1 Tax=Rhizobium sp. BK251 TaxID=2512125 RepID=UPI001048D23D|nr:Spy/CpxP family protein refolding chaperone [Rhizobium sp. BK251]TCL73505.1 hypothetical protein EV286_10334 [Rhizobium sp. BK251]
MKRLTLTTAFAVIGLWIAGGQGAHAQQANATGQTNEAGGPPDLPVVELYTAADAAAVLNARLIALKTVLELNADQEKLWQPVETAIRDIAAKAAQRAQERQKLDPPSDFLDVLDRIADAEKVRAQEIKSFVAAAKPLVASLSEEQKRRAPAFLGMIDSADGPQPTRDLWLFEAEEN